MARQVKAGKFKYNLETVLKVRKIREKKEQEKFADKKRVYNTEKEKEEVLRDEQHHRHDELRNMMGSGPIKDFADVLRRKGHLDVLKEDLEKQIDKVIEASKLLEDQRQMLIESMKKKQIMEKDKDNKLVEYKALMQNIEMKFLDEIATQRFMHEKIQRNQGKE